MSGAVDRPSDKEIADLLHAAAMRIGRIELKQAKPGRETMESKLRAMALRLVPVAREGEQAPAREPVAWAVEALADEHAGRWQDRDDAYWLMRLMQEVGELASSLAGDHKDSPEHELRQVGSIAINWLRRRTTPTPEAGRVTEERDAANAHIALLEGEGHTGCHERIFQAEQEVEALTRDLATLRERLAGEVGALKMAHADWCRIGTPETNPLSSFHVARCSCGASARNSALDRAVAVIRGEG